MKTTLSWKKGLMNRNFKIFSGENRVGSLKVNSLTNSGDGELNGKKIQFKTKGFFKQETQIFDLEDKTTIGKIVYNSWLTNARIEYHDNILYWQYDDGGSTKCILNDSDGKQITYQRTSNNGRIELEILNDILVLTGLFITNYYWKFTTYVYSSF
jgi:hypothetical protein